MSSMGRSMLLGAAGGAYAGAVWTNTVIPEETNSFGSVGLVLLSGSVGAAYGALFDLVATVRRVGPVRSGVLGASLCGLVAASALSSGALTLAGAGVIGFGSKGICVCLAVHGATALIYGYTRITRAIHDVITQIVDVQQGQLVGPGVDVLQGQLIGPGPSRH